MERDQLHKILEREAWIFREEFALAGSEERLEDVLQKHIDKLGQREDEPMETITVPDGKGCRFDLMLSKVTRPRPGEYDYLVVELKRPSQKITAEVLSQVERYALAVAADERFNGFKTSWTFLAVSNEMDQFAKRKAAQKDRPKGMVYNDAESNVVVWAKEWADIINDARARLWFFNEQLTYEANRDTAKAYLKRTHEKFIPKPEDESE